jgi:hypothetical protein
MEIIHNTIEIGKNLFTTFSFATPVLAAAAISVILSAQPKRAEERVKK